MELCLQVLILFADGQEELKLLLASLDFGLSLEAIEQKFKAVNLALIQEVKSLIQT